MCYSAFLSLGPGVGITACENIRVVKAVIEAVDMINEEHEPLRKIVDASYRD